MHLIAALLGYSAGQTFGKMGCLKIILLLVLFQGGMLAVAVVFSLEPQEIKGWFEPEEISPERAAYRACIQSIPDNRTEAEKKAGKFDSRHVQIQNKCNQ